MLNEYLRVQAEEIENAGGIVDKFMGDAVLAIFSGEGKERIAVQCAIDIQDRVSQLNKKSEDPIHIGIGLSVGDVVMGNMGSKNRLEYSIIGSTVNLAARLCSAAAGGEIIAQKEVVSADATNHDLGKFTTMNPLSVKGFAKPIACVRRSPDH